MKPLLPRRTFLRDSAATATALGLGKLVPVSLAATAARAAVDLPLPFWATARRLPPGTWYEIPESNKASDVKPWTINPNKPRWLNLTDGPGEALNQWCGGAFSPDYATYGALICHGNGHAQSNVNLLNNMVLAWNGDTTQWEQVIEPWYDPDKCLPGGCTLPGKGNAAATLFWRQGDPGMNWAAGTPPNQADPVRAQFGEYVDGVPAASHTYNHLEIVTAAMGGSPKGSLFKCALASPGVQGGGFIFSPHIADLSAKTWSRFNDTIMKAGDLNLGGAGCSASDKRRGKIYYLPKSPRRPSAGCIAGLPVHDIATRTTGACILAGTAANNLVTGIENGFSWVPHPADPNLDIVLNFVSTTTLLAMWAKDISALNGYPGFWQCNVSETPRGGGRYGGFEWCEHLNAVCALEYINWKTKEHPAQLTLWKLAIPVDRVSGTYVWSGEPLTRSPYQAGQPDQPADWGSVGSYNKFRYNRAARCFLLATHENMRMRAFRPTGLI